LVLLLLVAFPSFFTVFTSAFKRKQISVLLNHPTHAKVPWLNHKCQKEVACVLVRNKLSFLKIVFWNSLLARYTF